MEADWVLERTAIGQDEIARRTLRLPLNVRAVLLMVDGKSEVTDLQRKMTGMANGMATLQSLYNNGLVQKRSYSCDDEARASQHALEMSRQATDDAIANALAGLHQKARQVFSPQPKTPVQALANREPAGDVAVATAPVDVQAQPVAAPVAAPASKPVRRSLGLARMYMLDQMERMFGDKSDAARSLLRMATTREALVVAFNDCREVLMEMAGLERAQRIEQEFYAILPEA